MAQYELLNWVSGSTVPMSAANFNHMDIGIKVGYDHAITNHAPSNADNTKSNETLTTLTVDHDGLRYTDERGEVTVVDIKSYIGEEQARIINGSLDEVSGLLTLTRADNSAFDIDLNAVIHDIVKVNDSFDSVSPTETVSAKQIKALNDRVSINDSKVTNRDMTKNEIELLDIDAATVNGHVVEKSVPADAKFTDTETNTVLTLTTNSLNYKDELGNTTRIDLSKYLDDSTVTVSTGSLDANTGICTFSRTDGSSFSIDLGPLLDNTNMVTSINGKAGVVTLTAADLGTYTTVQIDDKVGSREPADSTIVKDANYVHTDSNFTGTEKTKLSEMEAGATKDQSPAEIKIAYESNDNTNPFDDISRDKLAGIEAGATADQSKIDIDGLSIDAGTVGGKTVGTSVPANAIFTDTETNTTLALNSNSLEYTDESGSKTTIDLSIYLDDTTVTVSTGVLNPVTGMMTFTRSNGTEFTADLSSLLDDTNLVTSVNGKAGVITLTASDVGTYTTVQIDDKVGTREPANVNIVKDANYVHTDNNYTSTDKDKLAGIEANATSDQTDIEIKIAYESNDNTNPFDDTAKAKLAGVESGATKDQSKADIDLLGINAGTVNNKTVGKSVPANAVFTDTETNTSLSLTVDTLTYTDELGNTTSINLSKYLDDTTVTVSSGVLNPVTGVMTFTRNNGSSFTVDLSALLDDTNMVTSVNGKAGVITLIAGDVGAYTKAEVDTAILSREPADVNIVKDANYVHTDSNFTGTEKTKLSEMEAGATKDQSKADIDLLGVDAATISGKTVAKNVPADAQFTDTETNTVLTLLGDSLNYTDENNVTWNIDLSKYLDNSAVTISTGVLNPLNGIMTYTRSDGSVFTTDLSALLDDTNLVTSVNGKAGIVTLVAGDVGAYSKSETDIAISTREPADIAIVKDSDYVHTDNNYTTGEKDKLALVEAGATADQTKVELDALNIDAGTVAGKTVAENVPAGAVFTDTETNTTISLNVNSLDYTDEHGNTTSIDLTKYLDDTTITVSSGTLNSTTGICTYVRSDNSTFDVDLGALIGGTGLVTSVNNKIGVVVLTASDVGAEPANVDIVKDASYVHTDSNFTVTEKDKLALVAPGATIDQSKADIEALLIDATTVNGKTVESNVPLGALFTDTNVNTTLVLTNNTLEYTDENGVTGSIDLSKYLDDTTITVASGVVDTITGINTFTRTDGSTFDVDFSGLLSSTGTVTSVNGKAGVVVLTASDVGAYSKSETDVLLAIQPNVLGTVTKGWIDSSLGDSATDTVNIHAQPGTVVEYFDGTELIELTLSTTAFAFTNSVHGGLDGLMYCDISGNIGFTVSADNHAMPAGNYIMLAKETQYYSGMSGKTFSYEPLNKTNNFLQNYAGERIPKPRIVDEINASDFGTIDVAVNSKDLFYRLEIVCASINPHLSNNVRVLFKDGVYTIDQTQGTNYHLMKIRGESQSGTIFKSEVPGVIKVASTNNIKNITLVDISITNFTNPEYFIMDNVKLTTTVDDGGLYYIKPLARHVKITNCELAYANNIYIGIDVSGYESIYLNNNKLNLDKAGHAWHNIRVSSPYSLFRNHSVTISNNTMYNGVTGIIFALDRYSRPIIAPIIENNHLFYCEEESISFDGIGNNTSMPVIANGVIATKSNDVNDRLVISADLVVTDGITANQVYTMTVDDHLEWFFCTLDEGSGIDGTVVPIYSFDAVAGTITLDTTTNASKIIVGGNIGIHSGAFGAVVRNNDVTGEYRGGASYKVNGISLWMNSFGAVIEDNTITSCASGINVAGGLMLSTYKSRAYNNMVTGNRFVECANDLVPYGIPVQFISHSEAVDPVNMYGNKFINNYVQGGVSNILLNNQKNFTYRDNLLVDIDVDWQYCAVSLPVPSAANAGEDFTEIIDDASGVPVSINTFTCTLNNGVYEWIPVNKADKNVLGTVTKGWIDSSLGDSATETVNIHVQPGTVVEYFNGTELVELTLSTTPFVFTKAIHGDSLTGLMYCDTTGNIGFTLKADNHEMPEGDFILLAKSANWYTGGSGVSFAYTPFAPTNHMLTRYGTYYLANPKIMDKVYAADFGTIDVAVNSKDLFARLSIVASTLNSELEKNLKVFFKDGTYTIDQIENANFQDMRLQGQSRDGTIFKSAVTSAIKSINACSMEDITLMDLAVSNYTTPDEFLMDNVLMTTTASGLSLYYVQTLSRKVKIINSEWVYSGSLYVALDIASYDSVHVKNNKFNTAKTGHAWHNIRIASPNNLYRNHPVVVEDNLMYNGVTGIFFTSTRYSRPIIGAVVNNNDIFYVEEESISFDGVGNNANMPVIANGTITNVANDPVDGRLIITPDLVFYDNTHLDPGTGLPAYENQPYTIAANTNLEWFFCTLDEGSGREGTVIPIYSYDATAGTITLDTFTKAVDVNIGGEVGIHSGSFDCVITNNRVTGEYRGGANNKVHGISLWLNVFGTLIENNKIIGCSSGINVAGGLMLSTYKSRTYNNVVMNNSFIECCSNVEYDRVPVSFISHSLSGSPVAMYGNKFINNTVQGGAANIIMYRQQKFTYRDNTLVDIDVDWTYCASALPVPSAANVGEDHTEIIDGIDGVPILIKRHVCGFDGTAYKWVSLADTALLNIPQTFTKAQRGNKEVIPYATSVSLDMDIANDFEITLTGDLTLTIPANIVPNQSGYIYVKQDATGSRLLVLDTAFKTSSGAGVVLSTTPNAVDIINYTVRDASTIDIFFSSDHR